MKVSVIIPTYNRRGFIGNAIQSVLNQTYPSIELIVVDDGSTDGSEIALEPFLDKIKYIKQDNSGVSRARNRGLEEATGEIIAFLDSDDEWLPQKIEMQVNFFKENPEALLCQTGDIWYRKGKRVNPKNKHQKYSGMIFKQCLPLCIVSVSDIALRKEILDIVGNFDESMPACEDYDLWLRITRAFPIHLIDLPLTIKHGGRPDQLSQSTPQMDKYRIQSMVQLLDSGVLTNEQTSWTLEVLEQKCAVFGNGCIKYGREEEGAYYLSLPETYQVKQ